MDVTASVKRNNDALIVARGCDAAPPKARLTIRPPHKALAVGQRQRPVIPNARPRRRADTGFVLNGHGVER